MLALDGSAARSKRAGQPGFRGGQSTKLVVQQQFSNDSRSARRVPSAWSCWRSARASPSASGASSSRWGPAARTRLYSQAAHRTLSTAAEASWAEARPRRHGI